MKNTVFAVSLLAGLMALFLSNSSLLFSEASTNPARAGGVTVYAKADFDAGKDGFSGSKQVEQRLVREAVSGRALQTVCLERWAGPALDFEIQGSQNLKIAFLAKGSNFQRAAINVFDQRAQDNTTPYGYRTLPNGVWRPVLYFLDRFRYNSRRSGTVNRETHYTGVRFFGSRPSGEQVSLSLDNFVLYRGEDRQPPRRVQGQEARGAEQGVRLSWQQAKDNVFPMVYSVARASRGGDFRKIAETHQTSFLDRTAGKGRYRYRVLACDFENNLGEWSKPVSVLSKSTADKQRLSQEERDRLGYARHIQSIHDKGRARVNRGRVVLYGDSLTGATVYPHKVAAELGVYAVEARGYAGKRTGWGREHAVSKALEPLNPEFMFILLGTNNVRGQTHSKKALQGWVDDLEAIVKKAKARGTVPLLGTIPPRGFDDPRSRPEAEFNERLIERARELQIPVAYIFEEIEQGGSRRKFIWKDGVHWTPAGMEAAARAWGKAMHQVGFALRHEPDPGQGTW